MKVTETQGYRLLGRATFGKLEGLRDKDWRETQSRNRVRGRGTQKRGETPGKISDVVLGLRWGETRMCNYILVTSID